MTCDNQEFAKVVKSVFKGFASRHSLSMILESKREVCYKSQNCILSIRCEYTYAETLFKEKEEDDWLVIGPYIAANFPNEKIMFTKRNTVDFQDSVSLSIIDNLELLEKYGARFLAGDFSWLKEYYKHE